MSKKTNLILLVGDDEYSKAKALESLCTSYLGKAASRDDMRVFYGGDSPISEIIESASTLPLFSTSHLIVVKNMENIPKDDRKAFGSFCENVPDFTVLILVADEKSLDKKLYKSLSAVADVKRFKKPYDNEIPGKVKEILRNREKQMSTQALSVLTFCLGNDLEAIEAAIEKLSLYIHPEKCIKVEDVEKMIELDVEYNSFALTEALSNKDIRRALIVLAKLLENGAKAHELIGVLGWQFGRFKSAKQMQTEGASQNEISSSLKVNSYFMNKFVEQLALFSEAELNKCLAKLMNADISVKSSFGDSANMLDVLLVELTGK